VNRFGETGNEMTDETLQRYHKAKTGLPAADGGREKRQIERLRRLATDANLDPEFSEKFLRFIIDEVIRHHQKIKDGG
jgi:chorismate mutase